LILSVNNADGLGAMPRDSRSGPYRRRSILIGFRWRPLREGDLAGVARIAAMAFPQHYEDPACFAERLALSPSWCFGLEDAAGALKGYLIAYPWPVGTIPPLNAPLGVLPEQRDALFLHDLAIHPAAAGTGQAQAILERVVEEARNAGIGVIALIAVNGTADFWRRQGFTVADTTPALEWKLASYGKGARYMLRPARGVR
jgi:GNAT superfamily N-acetyltransferase